MGSLAKPTFSCCGVVTVSRKKMVDELFLDFEPLVSSLGLELLDVELLSENKQTILRATVYKDAGVNFDDCVAVQNLLSDRLDETDPIADAFNLEVSSPGLERTLRRDKEFSLYKGCLCQVNLFAPEDGGRAFKGRLLGLTDGGKEIAVETENGDRVFERSNVSRVKLIYEPREN